MTKNKFDFSGFDKKVALDNAHDTFDDAKDNSVVHDDGYMHVNTADGTRYCFDIGQDISNAKYNSFANMYLRRIGVKGKVTGVNN